VGILGTGFGVTGHYPAWSAIDDVRIMGFAGRDEERASRISREFSLPITKGTLDSLLASSDIKIVVVAVPPAAQPALIEAALESGKHVFAEKPLTLSAETALRLIKLAEHKSLYHGVNFCMRQAQASLTLRRALEAGLIGTPWRAVISWHRGYRAKEDLGWNWKCDARQGGGVMNAMGVHILDLLIWMFSDVLYGHAVKHIHIPRRCDDMGREQAVTAEDAISLMLTFANNMAAFVSLDSTAIGGDGVRMDFYGSKGALHVRETSPQDAFAGFNVDVTDVHGRTETLLFHDSAKNEGRIGLVRDMAREFVKSIRENKPYSPSFGDGLKVVSVCQQLGLSSWGAV